MLNRLKAMSNERLLQVWDALGKIDYCPNAPFTDGLTTDEWAMNVLSEIENRGLKIPRR